MSFSQHTQALLEGYGTLPPQIRRDRLTSRILQLRNEIQALETCFNSISLPNCIPPEILSNIFVLLARDDRLLIYPNDRETLQWVRVTHVCRHWRKIALECTALWSHISFLSPKFAELMLSRSKDAPLSVVCLSHGRETTQGMVSRALSQAERLRTVKLSCHDVNPIDLTTVLSTWIRPAPLLETLMVSCDTDFPPTDLPAGITAGQTVPLLKYLWLENCRIPSWESLPLSANLTELHLAPANDSDMNPARPTVNQFLSSLSAMTSLRELFLERFLPYGRSTRPSLQAAPTIPIHLTSLKSVNLYDDATATERFFETTSITNTEKLTIALANSPSVDAIRSLMSKLVKSCNLQPRVEGVRALTITDISDVNEIYLPSVTATFELASPQHELRLSLRCNDAHLPAAHILSAMKDHVDFAQLSSLTVYGDCSLTEDDWKGTFTGLKHLASITHQFGRLSESFLTTLAEGGRMSGGDTAESDSQSANVNYPFLAKLELHNIDFAANYGTGDTTSLLISSLKSRSFSRPLPNPVSICVWSDHGLTRAMMRRTDESLEKGTVRFFFFDESIRRALEQQGEADGGGGDPTQEATLEEED